MPTNFKFTATFDKEFKRMRRKYKSLGQDLDNFKKRVTVVDLQGNKKFAVLYQDERVRIVKARFFCKYLKKATLRIIYAYHNSSGQIEFIELYFKGEKENEDRDRIKQYLLTTPANPR